ncbi:SDR family NAD(P)-dependent oxidoreductase [Paenibacillus hodogayensis]|uniref:SDR family NAD(P)-dependent oxidoreductase n=1 Tax=Paenibacillus hodogayensis TaxID=279208 RepID=A0ABV5W451_9BACL
MNETVCITGASRGLGFELARLFYARGYRVFPLVRSPASAAALLREMPECRPIVADVADDGCTVAMRTALDEHSGTLDLLINNAGISGIADRFANVSPRETGELFNVHCSGIIRTVHGALPMLERSSNPRIINISSRLASLSKTAAGEFNQGGFTYSYRMAKAAQNMLTLCLHQELSGRGIHVSAVHPGKIQTGCAAHDADLKPHEAAENVFDWCRTAGPLNSGQFVEAGAGKLPW